MLPIALAGVPAGRTLMIHPPYVHDDYVADDGPFVPDRLPFLPVAPLYAAELLERHGHAEPVLFDCQLHDLREAADLDGYDSYGIAVMGAQNIAPAASVHRYLTSVRGLPAERVRVGGQGVEQLSRAEFEQIFPGSLKSERHSLATLPGAMDIDLRAQLDRLPAADMRTYLTHEMTLPFSQGCIFGCSFCGAQTRQRESFFNVRAHLENAIGLAERAGVTSLDFYCTSLDFFQQALPGGDLELLVSRLEAIVEVREQHPGLSIGLRALTRADSYNAAMRSDHVRDLVLRAGFNRFGFGADGAASVAILRAMRKHADTLRSDLLNAFHHMEEHGLVPEILYVFGIPEDTADSLAETRALCGLLLETFPTSEYRGFPAKNEIPGNANWNRRGWRGSPGHQQLLDQPDQFLNLGFEALANEISHPDPETRLMVNRYAVDMSRYAHELGRVGSYLTVPVATASAPIMDAPTLAAFRDIAANYAPSLAADLTSDNLGDHRAALNSAIPKDH
ncbi:radical SAM protein [Streptomyces mayteni]